MIPYDSIVVFVFPTGRKYTKKLLEGQDWQTNYGTLRSQEIHEAWFGCIVETSLGTPVRVEEATIFDKLMALKRQTQIIYPKDIAYICLKLGAGPGRLITEAGCGSGGLTAAFSWYCGDTGKVISQDNREEFIKLTRRNLDWANLGKNVELYLKDLSEGFVAEKADALFLDVREPWLYLKNIGGATRSGAMIGFLLPTVNQVSELLLALESGPFAEVEVLEILLRNWKAVPDRLRPADRMCAHTSFLVFCRNQEPSSEFDNYMPRGTRQRKEFAAREERLRPDNEK